MPTNSDLIESDVIQVIFASGPSHANRGLIDRIAILRPELPLFVVGEFEPESKVGLQWIPYHLHRPFKENLAAVRAAIGKRRVANAAMILAPAVPLSKMRVIAAMIGGASLTAYDEDLIPVSGSRWGAYLMRRAAGTAKSQRTQLWIKRLQNPSDAEIPVRARAAQLYGLAASRIRAARRRTGMKGAQPLSAGVSVVIPSRNGRELLAALLPALVGQVQEGEVIVSDNGSSDGTKEWLEAAYPGVRVIQNATPLSFAHAVNAGIITACFSRTLLLNNDMVVQPGFIDALNDAFANVPELFCATAQIFFPPGIRREETGKAMWRKETPLDFPVRCDNPIPGENHTWVLYGSGGCSLFDTEKLRELGGVGKIFDPAYVEDLDLGYRAWKMGWPTVYAASAKVEHRHRATTSRYYTPEQLDGFVELNYLRFLIHAVGSPALFRRLWTEAIRRLQLKAIKGETPALETLRRIPRIGSRPPGSTGLLSETEVLALNGGDVAIFPGRSIRQGDPPVLIASPYLPFPLSHGGAVRIYNLMKHAAEDRDQILLAFVDELSTPPDELLAICREVILVRRHGTHYRRDTPLPDVVEEFRSEAFRACLKQTIQRWKVQVVQLEFTQMAQYAKDCHPAKTLLIEHDITLDLQEQLVATTTETGAALLELQIQLGKWREFETAVWKRVDCVITMSAKDEAVVSGAKRVACLPNGVDTDRFRPSSEEPEARRLLFIGSFAHLPNLLALDFFLREVWPLLGGAYALQIIAGSRHEYFQDFYRARVNVDLNLAGVEVAGFISDVREAYRRAEQVLAPLTASAGTNIKVLEAMAMGRVVVSTPAGVNGLDVVSGVDVIVANSGREMADAIRSLTENAGVRQEIEARARLTAERYDWGEIARAQGVLFRQILGSV